MAASDSTGLRPMRPIHRHPFVEEVPRHPFVEEVLPLVDEAARSPHAKHASAKPKPLPCQSLTPYQHQALSIIGGAHQDIRQRNKKKRNKKISGAYAALWLQDHDAFRWQGLAAHASAGVKDGHGPERPPSRNGARAGTRKSAA